MTASSPSFKQSHFDYTNRDKKHCLFAEILSPTGVHSIDCLLSFPASSTASLQTMLSTPEGSSEETDHSLQKSTEATCFSQSLQGEDEASSNMKCLSPQPWQLHPRDCYHLTQGHLVTRHSQRNNKSRNMLRPHYVDILVLPFFFSASTGWNHLLFICLFVCLAQLLWCHPSTTITKVVSVPVICYI